MKSETFLELVFNQCAFAPLKYHSDLRPAKKKKAKIFLNL